MIAPWDLIFSFFSLLDLMLTEGQPRMGSQADAHYWPHQQTGLSPQWPQQRAREGVRGLGIWGGFTAPACTHPDTHTLCFYVETRLLGSSYQLQVTRVTVQCQDQGQASPSHHLGPVTTLCSLNVSLRILLARGPSREGERTVLEPEA